MNYTTRDLIDKYKKQSSAVNKTMENIRPMEIKEIYKQDLLLCSLCEGLIAYKSFVIEATKNCIILSNLSSVVVEELILDSSMFLVICCPICEQSLGLKFVSRRTTQNPRFGSKIVLIEGFRANFSIEKQVFYQHRRHHFEAL